MQQRVKCANCGMIYDAYTHMDNMGLIPKDDVCPRCGSNAKDPIQQGTWTSGTTESQ